MIPITREQILKIAPRASPSAVEAFVNGGEVLAKAGVNLSRLRLAHAIAQWAYETNGFVEWSENLHYSAQRLLDVFPRYFTEETAARAAHEGPEAIANIVYDDRNPARRNKLGNVQDGDGWRFRGRGVMHTTGRDGYAEASKVSGIDLLAEPDKLASPALSLAVACSYWQRRGCNAHADNDSIIGVTKIINGGTNGLEGRRQYLVKAKSVLASAGSRPAENAKEDIETKGETAGAGQSSASVPAQPVPPTPPTHQKDQSMTDLSRLFPLIEQFAPTVGGLIAGPAGAKLAPLAVAGFHALADALELTEDRTPAAVAQKLNTMPTSEVPAALQAAEALVKAALPQPATPAPVPVTTPPAPAQGLYVDPTNTLIKFGVAVVAGFAAAKFGIDATTATNVLTPIAEVVASLAVIGAMAFSQWRSVSGANANTAKALNG